MKIVSEDKKFNKPILNGGEVVYDKTDDTVVYYMVVKDYNKNPSELRFVELSTGELYAPFDIQKSVDNGNVVLVDATLTITK